MSRVAKKPVVLPAGVSTTTADGAITVKGAKGSMSLPLRTGLSVVQDGQELRVEVAERSREALMHAGSLRAHLDNVVHGVSKGLYVFDADHIRVSPSLAVELNNGIFHGGVDSLILRQRQVGRSIDPLQAKNSGTSATIPIPIQARRGKRGLFSRIACVRSRSVSGRDWCNRNHTPAPLIAPGRNRTASSIRLLIVPPTNRMERCQDIADDDPEGVAYGEGYLYLTNGLDADINQVSPGPNGRFDGVPPAGDDTETQWDTYAYGIRDPEGIGYHPRRGTSQRAYLQGSSFSL